MKGTALKSPYSYRLIVALHYITKKYYQRTLCFAFLFFCLLPADVLIATINSTAISVTTNKINCLKQVVYDDFF